MRLSSSTRSLVAILGVIFLAVFGWMYLQANQTEIAYVFARDIPAYEFIGQADGNLRAVTVPANRDFTVITDPREIVGKYVGPVGVTSDALVQPNQLIENLPSGQRSFPEALLPVGKRAYVIDIPQALSGIFVASDYIDLLAIVNEDELPSADDRAVLLFQKVKTLGIIEEKFTVAFSVEQIAAYEGWKSIPGVTFTAAISQEANGDFPPLYQLPLYIEDGPNIQDIYGPPTPTPVAEPEQESAEAEEE
ncbi:MAG: SAF domain-containing protein [Chloroflexota bacterium]